MASQLLAVLAAAGLVGAGVGAAPSLKTMETRSAEALPSPNAVPVYRQTENADEARKRNCFRKNNRKGACAAYWDANGNWIGGPIADAGVGSTVAGLGSGGAGAGVVVPALAAAIGVGGLIIASDNQDSNP